MNIIYITYKIINTYHIICNFNFLSPRSFVVHRIRLNISYWLIIY